ncbi:hypothetical protein B7H23_07065 [Notoacmeibacter marinus]|uniref:HTH luxR-type domain-containing protein n=1 Tax=Notoacmeibacter marinus TaxID=1876515 RepID=A0A231V3B5_9HYPH|nr:LuxR family transcriptional regulator [Notoacmeibacter marinus]OXT02640.1 hypothetical protein B7H23_07065 [Notoacmeibacter marinus]
MDADQFADYVERLGRADSRDVVWSVVCGYFDQAGFDGVFYADLAPGRAILRTNLTKCWTDHYAAEHYFDIDPFFRHSCSQLAVTSTGQDYFDEHPYLDRQERQFILTAGETGMTAGLALPVRLAGPGGVGGWNVVTSHGRETVDRLRGSGWRIFHLAALLAHERMRDMTATDKSAPLTEREMETLRWAASGLRTKEIALKMRISAATVEFHGRNARHKLGAKTREQAVAIALTRGLIAM